MKIKKILSSLLAATMLFGSVTANAVTIESDDTPKRSGAAVEQESSSVAVTSNKTDHGLPAKLEDGAILHAWCWSCNTITANMKDIAAAGYTAIQTSPMQQSYARYSSSNTLMGKDGNGNDITDGSSGAWWWQYQPTAQKLGNYQFFTDPTNDALCEQEYKAMCDAADAYGISIITDIVSNHTTSHYVLHEVTDETTGEKVLAENKSGQIDISSDMTTAVGDYNSLWHTGTAFNENKTGVDPRIFLINYMNSSLPDINTENTNYQAYVVKYLNKLVELGCDGFRFDTAHHIGISDIDGSSYNFWEAVTGVNSVNDIQGTEVKLGRFTNSANVSPDDLFIYGEMIKSEYAEGYTKKIRITDFDYGKTVRNAVHNNSISTDSIMNKESTNLYKINGVSCNNVTWVESHDDYCNADKITGVHASAFLTEEDIKFSWAIITARKAGTPLYFNRPDGSNALGNNFWGNNVAGAKGNDAFKDPEVAAVNKFRNAMAIAGADGEYMWNIDNNSKVLQIDRYNNSDNVPGKCGTVIVNLSSNDKDIDTETKMATGQYFDSVSGNVFEVYDNNGTNYIKGHIYGRKTAVIYMTPEQYDAVYNTDDNYSLSEKNYVYFFNTFGKTDIKVSLSGKSAQPMIWSDALHCYYYEYPAESVSSVVFTTSDSGSYTATSGFVPGKLYVPTNDTNNTGSWSELSAIQTGKVFLHVKDKSWTPEYVKVYLYYQGENAPLRVNAAYPGESMTYLGRGVCDLSGDLYSHTYYYVDGNEYNYVKFVDENGQSDPQQFYRTTGSTLSSGDFWEISTGKPTNNKPSVTPSSLSAKVTVNKPITINYHYYDRAVGDPTTGTESSKEFSYTATTSDLSQVVTNGIGELGLENVYDKNVYFGTQLKYVLSIASYYDSGNKRNNSMTYGGRINPRFISNKTNSFGGRFGNDIGKLSVSGENWVTYYDSTDVNNRNVIAPEKVLPDLSNVASVEVWGFSKPKTYHVNFNYPTTNDPLTLSIPGNTGTLMLSDAYVGVSSIDRMFDETARVSNENITPHMITPNGYVFDGWYDIKFENKSSNILSNVKVSSQMQYNARVTRSMNLYAVYRPTEKAVFKPSATVTANSVDRFIDNNGNTRVHYNTMLNIFNCSDSDSKITDAAFVYVKLNNDTTKSTLDTVVNSLVGTSTKTGTSNGLGYLYYQYSVQNKEISLTNKNRVQHTLNLKATQQTGDYANTAVFAAFKYNGSWVISNNYVIYDYRTGEMIITESNY